MENDYSKLLEKAQKTKGLVKYFTLDDKKNKIIDVRDILKINDPNSIEPNLFTLNKDQLDIIWMELHPKQILKDTKVIDVQKKRFKREFKEEFERETKEYNSFIAQQSFLNKKNILKKNGKFEIDKIEITIYFKKKQRIFELFDALEMSEFIYMCKSDNFIKVHNKKGKLLLKQGLSSNKEDDNVFYTPGGISHFYEDKIELLLNFMGDTKYDNIINKVIKAFGMEEEDIEKTEKTNISGHFEVNNISIDKEIFGLFIQFDEIINKFILIDERSKIISDKRNIWIVFYEKMVSSEIYTNALNIVEKDEGGIRVRIKKMKNEKLANSFIHYFLRVCDRYIEKFDEIVDKYEVKKICGYTSINPSDIKSKIKTIDHKTKQKIMKLREDDPTNLFGYNYVRTCQLKSQPIKISKQEYEDELEAGNENFVMEFPLKNQSYYTCKQINNFKFIGLKHNKSEIVEYNASHPFLPCCFEKSQKNKQSGGWWMWKNNLTKVNKNKGILGPLTFLDEGRKGQLPFTLKTLMDINGVDSSSLYRLGMKKGGRSILDCLDFNNNKNDTHNISELQTFSHTISQEFYSQTQDQIKDYIKNSEYLNPLLVIPLLEAYYNINIYLFVENDIVIPPCKNGYILPPKDKKESVIILGKMYQNYLQCDLVELSTPLTASFRKMYESVFTNILLKNNSFEITPKIKFDVKHISKQYIDSSGKVQLFEINNSSVFVPPTYPRSHISSGETSDTKLQNSSILNAKKTLDIIGENIKFQYVKNNKCRALITSNNIMVECNGRILDKVKQYTKNIMLIDVHENIESELSLYKDYAESERISNKLKFIVSREGENLKFKIDVKSKKNKYNKRTNVLILNDKLIKTKLEYFKRSLIKIKNDEYPNFTEHPNELIFSLSSNSFSEWLKIKDHNQFVHTFKTLDYNKERVYFVWNKGYSNGNIFGLQNVDTHSLQSATYVSNEWIKTNNNVGYLSNALDTSSSTSSGVNNVFKYPLFVSGGKDKYASILNY